MGMIRNLSESYKQKAVVVPTLLVGLLALTYLGTFVAFLTY